MRCKSLKYSLGVKRQVKEFVLHYRTLLDVDIHVRARVAIILRQDDVLARYYRQMAEDFNDEKQS